MAIAAAGAALVLGSPMWLAFAAAIALGNIGTFLAAAWFYRKASRVERHGYDPRRRRDKVTREEAEEALAKIDMPPSLSDVLSARAYKNLEALPPVRAAPSRSAASGDRRARDPQGRLSRRSSGSDNRPVRGGAQD